MKVLSFLVLFCLVSSVQTVAGEVDVVKVKLIDEGQRSFRFDVTLSHQDTGWQHYADKWEILAPDGSVLGTRKLLHPHVDEQPFTRSLSGVNIPEHITEVSIRGHDSVHEYGGAVLKIRIP